MLAAQTSPNLALNQPVTSSGANWGSFKPGALTDGDPSTFTHPLAELGTRGFQYQVDLGRVYRLERIVIRGRGDGCCPERLTGYRVELFADAGGDPGPLQWSAGLRGDGSNPGIGGADTILAGADPDGSFAGRFIRITNDSGGPYNPQIAEIEAYGGMGPTIGSFVADADALARGESTTLRWQITNALSAVLEPGAGSVPATNGFLRVTPAATTTYTLTAANENGASSASVTVGVDVPLLPPVLNEFVADNAGGALEDEDGDDSDWIELRNPNSLGLPLGGFFLTDDPAEPRKWALPDVRIPGHGFLVVFASGKDRRAPGLPLHANFRLDADGDFLALVDRDGARWLSTFPTNHPVAARFPPQTPRASYGWGANGMAGFMTVRTPGTTNQAAFEGVVAAVEYSHPAGFHEANLLLALATSTPGAAIRYTLDRTEPTAASGRAYVGPISIPSTTVVVRAAAFRTGWAPSELRTRTYVFPAQVLETSVMRKAITTNALYRPQLKPALLSLPSLSLVAQRSINDTSEVAASVEWLNPDGTPGFQENCGAKFFGGAFTQFAKESFRLYFRRDYGAAKLRYPVFAGHDHGLAAVQEFDQLELRNGSHDMEMRGFYLSNIFTDDTLLAMGHLNPHGRFVHLYLNGTYWGVYHLRERWGAAMHSEYLGGPPEAYESINGNWNVGGWADPGTAYDGDGSVWARIKSLRSRYRDVRDWLDVPNYVDFMLMWMFGGSEDEYRCVGPTVPGSGFKFYLNDADGWFCVPNYCAAGNRTGRSAPGRQAGDGPGSLFSTLFKEADPDYRVLLADRIHRAFFNDGPLSPAGNRARLLHRLEQFEKPFLAESARWNYLTPAAWNARRDSVLGSWLPSRSAAVLAQYRGAGFYPTLDAPALRVPGGPVPAGYQVQFTGPSRGTLWFTDDGSDPRLPGGAVSPAARPLSFGGDSRTLLPAGATWRWYSDATGLGPSDVVDGHAQWSSANWKHPAFDDRAWGAGPAQFGYGEGDEATPIPFGGNSSAKWISSYYRHAFVLDSAASLTAARLRLKVDDGAVVYLNGREIARASMPGGSVTSSTPALSAEDDGQNFVPLDFPVAALVPGTNVLAVEVHQAAANSSDVSFDLELAVDRAATAGGTAPVLSRNTLLRARALDGTTWSALNEAFFQTDPEPVGPGDLVVSELDFHPSPAAGPRSEFVELWNRSPRAVNLRGAAFTNGIAFAFPPDRDACLAPGQRLLLVADLFAFQQRHGNKIPVAGVYSGRLDDAGERLALVAPTGTPLLSFRYRPSGAWPSDADGGGHTLVLARPEGNLDDPDSWRASASTNGSPGGTDATRFLGDPLADADQDGLPALLEYALGTSDLDPDAGPNPLAPAFEPDGTFAASFPRRVAADDLRLVVEASYDLLAWFPAQRRQSRIVAPGLARETWGVQAPGRVAAFLRLRVELLVR